MSILLSDIIELTELKFLKIHIKTKLCTAQTGYWPAGCPRININVKNRTVPRKTIKVIKDYRMIGKHYGVVIRSLCEVVSQIYSDARRAARYG